jgi:hypothetical protein
MGWIQPVTFKIPLILSSHVPPVTPSDLSLQVFRLNFYAFLILPSVISATCSSPMHRVTDNWRRTQTQAILTSLSWYNVAEVAGRDPLTFMQTFAAEWRQTGCTTCMLPAITVNVYNTRDFSTWSCCNSPITSPLQCTFCCGLPLRASLHCMTLLAWLISLHVDSSTAWRYLSDAIWCRNGKLRPRVWIAPLCCIFLPSFFFCGYFCFILLFLL